MLGECAAPAGASAGDARDERFLGEIVHRIDGIPRRFVAQAYGLGGLGEGAGALDLLEQLDARAAEEIPTLALEPQLAAQLQRRGLFAVHGVGIFRYVYN